MSRQAGRTARLEARIAPNALRIVRRAAELQGRSIRDFVVAAGQDVRRRVTACFVARELATADAYRGRKLGGALLWDAVERARRSEVAVYALVVDAKDELCTFTPEVC
jgi:GNAT superfamily N-acetyltransferase